MRNRRKKSRSSFAPPPCQLHRRCPSPFNPKRTARTGGKDAAKLAPMRPRKRLTRRARRWR
eukprot:12556224-Prorocentrum_lima.AAC.1